jgi:antitoxin component YwqK of YwqJK toxin-antitoxin module
MSIKDITLTGRESKAAEGLAGRIYALDEKNAQAIKSESMKQQSNKWNEISKAGSTFPQWAGSEVAKLKEKIPEFNGLAPRAVAKSVSNEYGHFEKVVEAKAKGMYREFATAAGGTERGIVSGTGENLVREGMWIERDAQNRVREIGSFVAGKPEGAFREYREDGSLSQSAYFKNGVQTGQAYKYNEKSEPIERVEFENGQAKEATKIDPVAVKQAQADRFAERKAQQSFTLAR